MKIIICDDDKTSLDRLEKMIKKYSRKLEVVALFSGEQVLEYIEHNSSNIAMYAGHRYDRY